MVDRAAEVERLKELYAQALRDIHVKDEQTAGSISHGGVATSATNDRVEVGTSAVDSDGAPCVCGKLGRPTLSSAICSCATNLASHASCQDSQPTLTSLLVAGNEERLHTLDQRLPDMC